MAGDCGCRKCRHTLPDKPKACKPFSICVGNHSLIWDGSCASIVPRTYTIPDGTFTSITFKDGCIIGVGEAPIPVYTPQACCDGDNANGEAGGNDIKILATPGNLITMQGDYLKVEPSWSSTNSFYVSGFGTADSPWKGTVKVSPSSTNRLSVNNDGLLVEAEFTTTDNVEVTGKGTKANPWKFTVKGADAKLPEVNGSTYVGNGFDIDKEGRVKNFANDIKFPTNLRFDSEAFSINYTGTETVVSVNNAELAKSVSIATGFGISGNGTAASPLSLEKTESVWSDILTTIYTTPKLKTQFNNIVDKSVNIDDSFVNKFADSASNNVQARNKIVSDVTLTKATVLAILDTIHESAELRTKLRKIFNDEEY